MEINLLDQTVKINLDPRLRTGVMVSGGMDSAALLFLILKEINDTGMNIDLRVYNVPNVNDNAKLHSQDVVNYLEKYFNRKINLINIGDGSAVPLALIRKPAGELLSRGLVDVLYSGQNQFPEEAQTWPAYQAAKGNFVRRDPNKGDDVNAKFPFIRLHKHHILEIYRKFNILDLASITHSCTTQTSGRCQSCLWCVERSWAFSRLGLVDN